MSTSSNWGYKDLVRNPELWKNISKNNATIADAVEQSKTWSDEEVAAAVRHFILEEKTSRGSLVGRILEKMGDRTHSSVLEILADRSLYGRLIEPNGEDIGPEAPFNRACPLLGDSPPADAVVALAPFLSAPTPNIRKEAALLIAKTGAPSIVPYLQKALLDSDEYVRSYALMGLQFSSRRLGEVTKQELFPAVVTLIQERKNTDNNTDILFELDNNRAMHYFLSPDLFNADSPVLSQILKTLGNANAPVPRDRLLSLIESLESKERPGNYSIVGALRLLGQQMRAEDEGFLRQRLSSLDESVAIGASNGLMCLLGLENFELTIAEKEQLSGYDSLSQQQKFFLSAHSCDAEINNGGLAQYFVNNSGDGWPDALEALAAMGMKERLAVLKDALALFAAKDPRPIARSDKNN